MIKTCVVSLVILFSTIPIEWLNDFESAKEIAGKKNQHILLNFSGSDWCAPCILMKKEIFSSDTFQQYAADNLVLVQADFPRLKKNKLSDAQVKQNEALADRYNPHGKFPYTLLLNAKGEVITSWEGYKTASPQQFIEAIRRNTDSKNP